MFSGVPLSFNDLLAMGHLTESTTDPGIRMGTSGYFSMKDFLLNANGIHINFQSKFAHFSSLVRCRRIQ